jgi:hypothetical protein
MFSPFCLSIGIMLRHVPEFRAGELLVPAHRFGRARLLLPFFNPFLPKTGIDVPHPATQFNRY